MKKIKAIDIFYPLTAVMPIAISMAVCSNIVTTAFLLSALIYSLIYKKDNLKLPMQVYLAFLIINQVSAMYGMKTAIFGMGISSILLLISSFLGDKLKKLISPAITSAVMISTAFSMTALQTTNYFGIGATGNTVVEMLKNYRSLGFHPNWRGILYGTIVMVIMITFPRKFKRLSAVIKAPFIALIFVMLLNLVLVPSNMISPIAEVGRIAFEKYDFTKSGDISIIYALLCGLSLFFSSFTLIKDDSKGEKRLFSSLNLCASVLGGYAYAPCSVTTNKSVLLTRIIGLLPLAICIPLSIPFARAPVSACAVVLIVGTWQSVKWGELKKAFLNPLSAVGFALSIAATVLTDFPTGITISALISILLTSIKKNG